MVPIYSMYVPVLCQMALELTFELIQLGVISNFVWGAHNVIQYASDRRRCTLPRCAAMLPLIVAMRFDLT